MKSQIAGSGIAVGIALVAAFGVLFGNLALWIGIGAALGLALSVWGAERDER